MFLFFKQTEKTAYKEKRRKKKALIFCSVNEKSKGAKHLPCPYFFYLCCVSLLSFFSFL